jgi:hypothetical protein
MSTSGSRSIESSRSSSAIYRRSNEQSTGCSTNDDLLDAEAGGANPSNLQREQPAVAGCSVALV